MDMPCEAKSNFIVFFFIAKYCLRILILFRFIHRISDMMIPTMCKSHVNKDNIEVTEATEIQTPSTQFTNCVIINRVIVNPFTVDVSLGSGQFRSGGSIG